MCRLANALSVPVGAPEHEGEARFAPVARLLFAPQDYAVTGVK